jgi:hypothetical protein
MKMELYKYIALKLNAIENCKASNNTVWLDNHTDDLNSLIEGLNNGQFRVELNDSSKDDRIILDCNYTVRSNYGYSFDLNFTVTITASLLHGFNANFSYNEDDINCINEHNEQVEDDCENDHGYDYYDYDYYDYVYIESDQDYIEEYFYHMLGEAIEK